MPKRPKLFDLSAEFEILHAFLSKKRFGMEETMKNREHKLKIGFVPTRREAFSHPLAFEQKKSILEKFRGFSKEMDFELIDIEDLNAEGMLMTYAEVESVYRKLSGTGVDALIFPHCNFGQEEAVGRLAKDMQVPVLVWGPRDGRPNGLEWRPTDSQCGMFASTKLLQRYGVKFTYIENCELDSPVLKKGLSDFLAVVSAVKAFRAMRVAKISTRPKEFLSVAVNENELLEKFDIEIVPGDPMIILGMADEILAGDKSPMDALIREWTDAGLHLAVPEEKQYAMAAVELALLRFAGDNRCTAIACECWNLFAAKYGIAACFILGDMNDKGIPAACENDIQAAIASAVLTAAARYKTPSFVADLTIRHPDHDNAELLWHCGSFAKRLKHHKAEGQITVNGKGFYELEEGTYTIVRFDELSGNYYLFAGEAKSVEGPVTNGAYVWVEVEDWIKWEQKFIYGPYIHHVVGIPGAYGGIMKEFCRYTGVCFDHPDSQLFVD